MGEVGTKLVFENGRVKVWEFTLEPGEAIAAHTHQHDYFFFGSTRYHEVLVELKG